MIRILTILAVLLFSGTGYAQESPIQEKTGYQQDTLQSILWTLTCWQGGQKIIDEHAMTDFTYGTTSFSAALQKDGKIYVSGLDQNSGTVCKVIEYHR